MACVGLTDHVVPVCEMACVGLTDRVVPVCDGMCWSYRSCSACV